MSEDRVSEREIDTIQAKAARLATEDKPSEEWMGSEDERAYHGKVARIIAQLREERV